MFPFHPLLACEYCRLPLALMLKSGDIQPPQRTRVPVKAQAAENNVEKHDGTITFMFI